jgi:hypothetical protein
VSAGLSPRPSLLVGSLPTQYLLAVPLDPTFKCVDGTIRAELLFLAVPLHQLERAVATSHHEAEVICVHSNPSLSCHASLVALCYRLSRLE